MKTLNLPGRAALRQACRVVVAAALALSAAEVLGLRLPLWSVLTALVVTQISSGKSLRATMDYLIGTLSGAAFGVVVALLVPNPGPGALVGMLVLAIAPLAILAAWMPSFAIAPATAAIVILLPAMTHVTPTASALDRILEVVVGAAIGLAVSFAPPRSKAAPRDQGE
ncbi:MAG TPA: FUSC family protein [Acidocella sp.]|nr:FUSC family protein [Acidocella sp.]